MTKDAKEDPPAPKKRVPPTPTAAAGPTSDTSRKKKQDDNEKSSRKKKPTSDTSCKKKPTSDTSCKKKQANKENSNRESTAAEAMQGNENDSQRVSNKKAAATVKNNGNDPRRLRSPTTTTASAPTTPSSKKKARATSMGEVRASVKETKVPPAEDSIPTVELMPVPAALTVVDVEALGVPVAQAYVPRDSIAVDSNSNYDRMAPLTVVANKPPPGQRFGINIKAVNGCVYISDIAQDSPFWNTPLRVGHMILSINDVPCQGVSAGVAASFLPQSVPPESKHVIITVQESPMSVITVTGGETVTATTSSVPAQPPPPPGAPPGGMWTTETYKPECAKFMICICVLAGLFFWPAFFFACCACAAADTRRVYHINGAHFGVNGERV